MQDEPGENEHNTIGYGAIVLGGSLVLLGVMVFSTLISPFGDPRLTVLCGLGVGLVSVMLLMHDESR
jgi:hypothetical protein